jgi:rhamnogalacturonyl hydrolase YesR
LATHLQIPAANGHFRHAWAQPPTTAVWADKTTGVSSEVWSEGQGWHTLLMADVFDWLPTDHAAVAALKTQRDKLAAALKASADPNTGMWCQVVDKCTQAGNWNESSGTGMYVYFLQKSINRGYLAAADYQAVVTKAYAGLKTKATNNNGTISVKDISSIGVANNYQAYISSSKDVDKPSGMTSFMLSSLTQELPDAL